MLPNLGAIMQHGYVVKNLQEAALEWTTKLGIGPFYSIENLQIEQCHFRNVQTKLEISVAFAYWGGIQIELIQQLSDERTLYSEAASNAAGKLNHCATIVDDIDLLLQRHKLNNRILQSGAMPNGLRFVYLDQYLPGSYHLELIEAQNSTLQAFAGMQAVTKAWNGLKPFRPIAALGEDLAALNQDQVQDEIN